MKKYLLDKVKKYSWHIAIAIWIFIFTHSYISRIENRLLQKILIGQENTNLILCIVQEFHLKEPSNDCKEKLKNHGK